MEEGTRVSRPGPNQVQLERDPKPNEETFATLYKNAVAPEQSTRLRKDILSYERVRVRQGCPVAQPGVSAGVVSVGRCVRPGLRVSFARGCLKSAAGLCRALCWGVVFWATPKTPVD